MSYVNPYDDPRLVALDDLDIEWEPVEWDEDWSEVDVRPSPSRCEIATGTDGFRRKNPCDVESEFCALRDCMSLRVTDVAQAAKCPKRLASLVTLGSGHVRPSGRSSRSHRKRKPSTEEQLLGKVFEQTIQHGLALVGEKDIAEFLRFVVDALAAVRGSISFGELPLGFTLEDFDERERGKK